MRRSAVPLVPGAHEARADGVIPAWQQGLDSRATWMSELAHAALSSLGRLSLGAALALTLAVAALAALGWWVYLRACSSQGRHKRQNYQVLPLSRSVDDAESWLRDRWSRSRKSSEANLAMLRGTEETASMDRPAPPVATAGLMAAQITVPSAGSGGATHPAGEAVAGQQLSLADEKVGAGITGAVRVVQPESPASPTSPYELPLSMDGAAPSSTNCYARLEPSRFSVRSHTYLTTGEKAPSERASELLAVELFTSERAFAEAAMRPDAPSHTLHARTNEVLDSIFAVSLVLPAPTGVCQLVLYFGMHAKAARGPPHELLQNFVGASDAFRNARFKLLPAVAMGPWLVQKAVGTRPAILGKALKQRFYTGITAEGHLPIFEVCADCNSSPTTGRIISLVKSYARSLVVDLAFMLEAQRAAEMPERLIGCARLCRIDLDIERMPILHS